MNKMHVHNAFRHCPRVKLAQTQESQKTILTSKVFKSLQNMDEMFHYQEGCKNQSFKKDLEIVGHQFTIISMAIRNL